MPREGGASPGGAGTTPLPPPPVLPPVACPPAAAANPPPPAPLPPSLLVLHRYMATSDLANELAKDSFRFDSPTTEKQVSEVVLTQLEDASGDISGLAVKWCVAA